MGPRPIGRGNVVVTPCLTHSVSLQWGRDQLVAEMQIGRKVFGFRTCFNGAATNWSRKWPDWRGCRILPAASMGPRPIGRGNKNLPPSRPSEQKASMGPRPIGRGNSLLTTLGFCRNALQWGRDQLVAEIADRAHACISAACFNGAATNWSRKFTRPKWTLVGWRRFNGAATNWSRKCPSGAGERAASPGFNGAATNWSRKYVSIRFGNCWKSSFNGAATNWSRK